MRPQRLQRIGKYLGLSLVMIGLPLAVQRFAFSAGAMPQEGATQDSDYEVVKLLTRLFGLIKRNYVETLHLSGQLSESRDAREYAERTNELKERIAFVEKKGDEYVRLMPNLEESYPQLRSIIASFREDVTEITKELEAIKQRHKLDSLEPANATSADKTVSFPVTLEVRDDNNKAVADKPVVFLLEPPPQGVGKAGIIAENSELVDRAVARTDKAGKATVKMRFEHLMPKMTIKRIIEPGPEQTICRLIVVP